MIDARLWFMDQSVHPSATAFNLMLVKETCSFRLVGRFCKLTKKEKLQKRKSHITFHFLTKKEQSLNRAYDDSTYNGQKLAHSAINKKMSRTNKTKHPIQVSCILRLWIKSIKIVKIVIFGAISGKSLNNTIFKAYIVF